MCTAAISGKVIMIKSLFFGHDQVDASPLDNMHGQIHKVG